MAAAPLTTGPAGVQDGPVAGTYEVAGTSAIAQEDDRTPHLMRIAAQGKLRTYVAFALKFLQESHDRPLVLHSLPPPSKAAAPPPAPAEDNPNPADPPPKPANPQPKSLASSTTCIPRLISVVEIIKREFVELMSTTREKERQAWVLHQYNELGCLEDTEGGSGAGREKTGLTLIELLEGKNHLQIKRTPYMKITLTKKLLTDHDPKKSTYQEPLPSRKRSKSAKARERKKRKRAEAAAVPDAETTDILTTRDDVAMNEDAPQATDEAAP
ncbi:hypothetical protein CALVIDRAFT_598030 [Calocera viscosa TUFC12733]|uniref:Uncharacterized protein n=1 Tax=Calocera viscosa (strain TUFC12733) TaxID=1330018 RepID=A0A167MNI6_CALVF|nr:hypothetical protein CALVIDRAFT_598030 [Calocera viscosa TUFC12733]